ncbi:MAG: hypothetical protein F2881_10450 [Actinobacteria bacterium]|uniref:Unannotated protein n=1 Tax=freshwater metagenome TaxID=449393 RepID=A0A6J7RCP8_9ZZZZ|nr:hypothetical protein [Actinomycetota bacterium]
MSAALLYEWRRITSIRSTAVLAVLYLLASAAVAYLLFKVMSGAVGPGDSAEGVPMIPLGMVMGAGTNPLAAIFLTTIAAQSFGHEYRYGVIRLTLSEFPRRWVVFVAKALMVAASVVALFLGSIVVTSLTVTVLGGSFEGLNSDLWLQLVRGCAYLLGYCLLAFAITLLTHNLVLGVVIPLLLSVVVEPLAAAGLSWQLPWLPNYLPLTAGSRFLDGGETMMQGGLVYLAWVVALMVVSFAMLQKRDA